MNRQTKHLILTPFNFQFFCEHTDSLSDEWMEKRMEIFLNVTYPSLMSQTVMDFEWIIGFDTKTPAKWKEKINKIKGIQPVYPKKAPKVWINVIKFFKEFHGSKYLLTTRIDSDDAFAKNAIQSIQSLVDDPYSRYINLLHGLVTDGNIVYRLDYKSNSFISRMERTSKAESVRTIDHTDAKFTKRFQQIKNMPPLWLIYIHGLNYGWTMETMLDGHLREHSLADRNALDDFNINI